MRRALDTATEIKLLAARDEVMKACTMLVIADRLAAVRHADLILEFEAGSVVESGGSELPSRRTADSRSLRMRKILRRSRPILFLRNVDCYILYAPNELQAHVTKKKKEFPRGMTAILTGHRSTAARYSLARR